MRHPADLLDPLDQCTAGHLPPGPLLDCRSDLVKILLGYRLDKVDVLLDRFLELRQLQPITPAVNLYLESHLRGHGLAFRVPQFLFLRLYDWLRRGAETGLRRGDVAVDELRCKWPRLFVEEHGKFPSQPSEFCAVGGSQGLSRALEVNAHATVHHLREQFQSPRIPVACVRGRDSPLPPNNLCDGLRHYLAVSTNLLNSRVGGNRLGKLENDRVALLVLADDGRARITRQCCDGFLDF